MSINTGACDRKFAITGRKVTAELLHLSLQRAGYGHSHELLNRTLVPMLDDFSEWSLVDATELYRTHGGDKEFNRAWSKVPRHVKMLVAHPKKYTGRATAIAKHEARNALKAM